ncbi:MAG: metal-sensitive transcriptional regulator [candidate division Zixibacteria bacterium]|nr:metal-sensitive transcriptional regulator [candidate division Zixibacteria bacterium]
MIEKARKKALNDRLNRIQGQIEGLRKMIGEERPCLEILAQISSVHEALRGVGKMMLRNYLESCATRAIRSRDRRKAEETYNDLMEVIYKFAK